MVKSNHRHPADDKEEIAIKTIPFKNVRYHHKNIS